MNDAQRAIVDLRDAAAYARGRPAGAVRLQPQELLHAQLLPPRDWEIVLVGRTAEEIAPYIEALHKGGRPVVLHYPGEEWRERLPCETGSPSCDRLWQPAEVVRRALQHQSRFLPGISALDLACGSGRNAVYLALAGFAVTAVDILPDALSRARDLAARHGVAIRTLQRDLESPGAIADLRADLVVVVRYLDRSLFPGLQEAVAPGGILAYETFSEPSAPQDRPRNPRFVLRAGELLTAFPALEVLEYGTGLSGGAHVARLVARRPPGPPSV